MSFEKDNVDRLKPGLSKKKIESLSSMDDTDNLLIWKELGELAAEEQVDSVDFPNRFDLRMG